MAPPATPASPLGRLATLLLLVVLLNSLLPLPGTASTTDLTPDAAALVPEPQSEPAQHLADRSRTGMVLVSDSSLTVLQQELTAQATLETLQPEVQWAPTDGDWQTVPARQTVQAGERVRTSPSGRARLVYFEGSVTEVSPGTGLLVQRLERTPDGNMVTGLLQSAGTTISRVIQLVDPAARFEIETPAATAFVRGTTPQVQVGGTGTTRVANLREGTAGLVDVVGKDPDATRVTLQPGQETLVTPGLPPRPPSQIGAELDPTELAQQGAMLYSMISQHREETRRRLQREVLAAEAQRARAELEAARLTALEAQQVEQLLGRRAPVICSANPDTDSDTCIEGANNRIIGGSDAPEQTGLEQPAGNVVDSRGIRLYIANTGANNVVVFDFGLLAPVATIPVGSLPQGIDINDSDSRVYVANTGDDTVSVLDTTALRVVATIPIPAALGAPLSAAPAARAVPFAVAVNTRGTEVYVANRGTNTVAVIDARRNQVVAQIPVGALAPPAPPSGGAASPCGTAGAIAVNPAGTRVYTANCADNTVSVIDTLTRRVIATVPVGPQPTAVDVDPSGREVLVTSAGSNTLQLLNAQTHQVSATIPVGTAPSGVAVIRDGTLAYVANRGSRSISVVNLVFNRVIATLQLRSSPVHMTTQQ